MLSKLMAGNWAIEVTNKVVRKAMLSCRAIANSATCLYEGFLNVWSALTLPVKHEITSKISKLQGVSTRSGQVMKV